MGLGQTQTQSAKLVCQGPCWPEKVTETKLAGSRQGPGAFRTVRTHAWY